MTQRFAGRIAAVTGAASGLGRATAIGLAREGARVLLFDRDAEGLAATATDCPGSISITGDAASSEDVARAAATAREKLGPVTLLATAAGILGPTNGALGITEEQWDRLFAINVKGTWLAARAFIPQMREAGGGAICAFASAAGLVGAPIMPAYSASKGAVILLTRSLAAAHGPEQIRVNCVCPGSIETPMLEETFSGAGDAAAQEARRQVFRARHPLGRFGKAQEVADAVLYLLSDAAGFVNGIAMPVDGGRLA